MSILRLIESRENITTVEGFFSKGNMKNRLRKVDYKLSTGSQKQAVQQKKRGLSAGRGLAKAVGVGAAGVVGARLAYKGAKKLYKKIRGQESAPLVEGVAQRIAGIAKKADFAISSKDRKQRLVMPHRASAGRGMAKLAVGAVGAGLAHKGAKKLYRGAKNLLAKDKAGSAAYIKAAGKAKGGFLAKDKAGSAAYLKAIKRMG